MPKPTVKEIFSSNISGIKRRCGYFNQEPIKIKWSKREFPKDQYAISACYPNGLCPIFFAPSRKQAKLLVSTLCLLTGLHRRSYKDPDVSSLTFFVVLFQKLISTKEQPPNDQTTFISRPRHTVRCPPCGLRHRGRLHSGHNENQRKATQP